MWPTLEALKRLGGSGTISEILENVVRAENFTEEQQAVKRGPDDHMSMIEYRLAWARNGLKLIGAIENSARGVWSLTDAGKGFSDADSLVAAVKKWRSEYNRQYQERKRQSGQKLEGREEDLDTKLEKEIEPDWKEVLRTRLVALSPGGFERLCQRLLREAGFRDVEVLGKSGDGGIDGVGVLRISLVAFPVYFQCKRYKDSVGAGAVRDFRGAMAGRGEKGLLITTGTFTREARQEASRDGAPPVELVSGDELADLLKLYDLGVATRQKTVEDVSVDSHFFEQFD
jgi:restriction system protein